MQFLPFSSAVRVPWQLWLLDSGGLSQDFAGLGQNRVTAKKQVRAGLSYSASRNITVAKFN